MQRRQPRAAHEGIVADVFERGGQRQLYQPRAILERVRANVSQRGGERQRRQPGAATEGVVADGSAAQSFFRQEEARSLRPPCLTQNCAKISSDTVVSTSTRFQLHSRPPRPAPPLRLEQVNEQLKEYASRLKRNPHRTEVELINSQMTYLKDIYKYEVAGESEKDANLKRINNNVKAVAKAQIAHNRFRVRQGLKIATAVILQTPALLLALPFGLPVMAAEYLTL
jgi:hypothetical protein